MLEVSLAEKLIEQITKYTDYNVNIMNREGIIIASRDPERIGMYHEPAWQILHENQDIITVNSDKDYPGAIRGINMVIDIDGKREGVVGVTGNPEEIRPIALIIKMSIETMIRYENQKIQSLRRQTKKQQLQDLILSEGHPAPAKLRSLTEDLGCSPDIPRFSLLCHIKGADCKDIYRLIKSCPLHSEEDLILFPGPEYILIFKSVTEKDTLSSVSTNNNSVKESAIMKYRRLLIEYTEQLQSLIASKTSDFHIYAGTLQDTPSQYHAAYSHCKWMENHISDPASVNWFRDHTGRYLAECIPFRELRQIFGASGKFLSEEDRKHCLELIGSLTKSDFNISAAAKNIFMHKNTFTYQYNKLREELNLNPQVFPQDKWIMIALYLYLSRSVNRESED